MTIAKLSGRKTARIYCGPVGHEKSVYWTVAITDAKNSVTVNGAVAHALRAKPGVTVGCALSNVASDAANVKAFPHPVKLVSITKSTAYVVDKVNKAGIPSHAVRYGHNYGRITDCNDQRTLNALVKESPETMERPFTLYPPRARRIKPRATPVKGAFVRKVSGVAFVPRGALARAVKSGVIGEHVAEQLSSVAGA